MRLNNSQKSSCQSSNLKGDVTDSYFVRSGLDIDSCHARLQLFTRTWFNFFTFTFRAPGRNQEGKKSLTKEFP